MTTLSIRCHLYELIIDIVRRHHALGHSRKVHLEVKSPVLKIGILVTLVLFVGGVGAFFSTPTGYNNGYQPDQPIPYDHSLHAGVYKIPCQYCHSNVEKSRHATVPSLNICMNCHKSVKTESPWIQKITKAYERGESIPWVKVTMLPDYVMFNHKRHVQKGVSCQTCHGAIEQMQTVYQKESLSMGWCVECHRKPENNASTNCDTCHY